MIYWFQPYVNDLRQILSTLEELSLLILFGEILILFLNIEFYPWLSVIIIIHAILHTILLLVYPSFRLYTFAKFKEDIENKDKK